MPYLHEKLAVLIEKCEQVYDFLQSGKLQDFFVTQSLPRSPPEDQAGCSVPENFVMFNNRCKPFLLASYVSGNAKDGKALLRIEYLYALRDIISAARGFSCLKTPIHVSDSIDPILPSVSQASTTSGLPRDLANISIPSGYDSAEDIQACLSKLIALLQQVASTAPKSNMKGIWITGHPGIGT